MIENTIWVLIISMVGGGSTVIGPYDSLQSCKEASEQVYYVNEDRRGRYAYICVPMQREVRG